MQVKALKRFNDLEAKKIRTAGETFEVSEERFEVLLAANENEPFVEKLEGEEPPKQTGVVVNLDEDVKTVNSMINAELGRETLESLLQAEREGKDRKGVTEHIESLLKEGE